MSCRWLARLIVALLVGGTFVACSEESPVASGATHHMMADVSNHQAAAGADKGYIDGWFDGEDVSLFYTKSFFCEEPPASGAATDCEIGANAEVYPRPGPLPRFTRLPQWGFSLTPPRSRARPVAHASTTPRCWTRLELPGPAQRTFPRCRTAISSLSAEAAGGTP